MVDEIDSLHELKNDFATYDPFGIADHLHHPISVGQSPLPPDLGDPAPLPVPVALPTSGFQSRGVTNVLAGSNDSMSNAEALHEEALDRLHHCEELTAHLAHAKALLEMKEVSQAIHSINCAMDQAAKLSASWCAQESANDTAAHQRITRALLEIPTPAAAAAAASPSEEAPSDKIPGVSKDLKRALLTDHLWRRRRTVPRHRRKPKDLRIHHRADLGPRAPVFFTRSTASASAVAVPGMGNDVHPHIVPAAPSSSSSSNRSTVAVPAHASHSLDAAIESPSVTPRATAPAAAATLAVFVDNDDVHTPAPADSQHASSPAPSSLPVVPVITHPSKAVSLKKTDGKDTPLMSPPPPPPPQQNEVVGGKRKRGTAPSHRKRQKQAVRDVLQNENRRRNIEALDRQLRYYHYLQEELEKSGAETIKITRHALKDFGVPPPELSWYRKEQLTHTMMALEEQKALEEEKLSSLSTLTADT